MLQRKAEVFFLQRASLHVFSNLLLKSCALVNLDVVSSWEYSRLFCVQFDFGLQSSKSICVIWIGDTI